MAIVQVALATEDVLSEAIGIRILAEMALPISVNHSLGKKGSGYLRSRMNSWRQIARHQVVMVLTDLDRLGQTWTDLDRMDCPIALLDSWTVGHALPKNLLLRIAVREIESWVMADHVALRELLGGKGKLPADPDSLADPKQHFLGLARLAPRSLRAEILKEKGAIASQGIGYNAILSKWVQSTWNPSRAAARSPSLQRTLIRISELTAKSMEAS